MQISMHLVNCQYLQNKKLPFKGARDPDWIQTFYYRKMKINVLQASLSLVKNW